jgi:hypothetical protein
MTPSLSFVLIRRSQSSARARTDFLTTDFVVQFDDELKFVSWVSSSDLVCRELAGIDDLSDRDVDRWREPLLDVKDCC